MKLVDSNTVLCFFFYARRIGRTGVKLELSTGNEKALSPTMFQAVLFLRKLKMFYFKKIKNESKPTLAWAVAHGRYTSVSLSALAMAPGSELHFYLHFPGSYT